MVKSSGVIGTARGRSLFDLQKFQTSLRCGLIPIHVMILRFEFILQDSHPSFKDSTSNEKRLRKNFCSSWNITRLSQGTGPIPE